MNFCFKKMATLLVNIFMKMIMQVRNKGFLKERENGGVIVRTVKEQDSRNTGYIN